MNKNQQKKLGQLLVFGFDGPVVTEGIKRMIREHYLGNIILFSRNIQKPEQLLSLTTELQQIAKNAGHEQPLAICVDQENGAVRRLGDGTTMLPGSMLLGAAGKPQYAREVGSLTAKELSALGVNWNLAPVVDVNNNPNNPVIGVRSFGENPQKVALLAKEMMKGMQEQHVITTLKHFPGHGDTDVDSHHALPVISHSKKRLFEIELIPFKACIDAGADMIMSAHVVFPAFEPDETIPATLSKKVMTDLLRKKLGFKGVVTTDCLEMDAIAGTVGTAQGALKALQAGADLLMVSHRLERQEDSIATITKAFDEKEVPEEQLDQAYTRVRNLKRRYLSWDRLPNSRKPSRVGTKEHVEKAAFFYSMGVTAVGDKKLNKNKPVLVFYPEKTTRTLAEDPRDGEKPMEIALKETLSKIVPFAEEPFDRLLTLSSSYEQIVVATRSMEEGSVQQRFIEALLEQGHEPIVIGTQNPYDHGLLPGSLTFVATYEHTEPAISTAFSYLYGEGNAAGSFPVTTTRHKGGGVSI